MYIKDSESNPFFVLTHAGCEVWSNRRDVHIVISQADIFNVDGTGQHRMYLVVCWLRYAQGWEKGNNAVSVPSVDEYMRRLAVAPDFSNAVAEYRNMRKQEYL